MLGRNPCTSEEEVLEEYTKNIKKLLKHQVKQNTNQTTKSKNRLLKENEVITESRC